MNNNDYNLPSTTGRFISDLDGTVDWAKLLLKSFKITHMGHTTTLYDSKLNIDLR